MFVFPFALQGLSRLLRQEQSSALDRKPRWGLVLEPVGVLKSRRSWLRSHKADVPTSTDAAINSTAEQPAASGSDQGSDYSSVFIPRDVPPADLHPLLAKKCIKSQQAGTPSKLVGVGVGVAAA